MESLLLDSKVVPVEGTLAVTLSPLTGARARL